MAKIRKNGAFIYLNAKELAGNVNPARDAFKARFTGSKYNQDTYEWEIPLQGIDENIIIQFLADHGIQADMGGQQAQPQQQPQNSYNQQPQQQNNSGNNSNVSKIWMHGADICLKSPIMKGREDIKNLMKAVYQGAFWDKNHWKIPANTGASIEDVIAWFKQWNIIFEIGGKNAIPTTGEINHQQHNQQQQQNVNHSGGNGSQVKQNGHQPQDIMVSINGGGSMITIADAVNSVRNSGQAVKITLIP